MYSAPDTLDAVVGQVGQFLLVDGKEMSCRESLRIDGLSALEFTHDVRSEDGQTLKRFIEDETLPADD